METLDAILALSSSAFVLSAGALAIAFMKANRGLTAQDIKMAPDHDKSLYAALSEHYLDVKESHDIICDRLDYLLDQVEILETAKDGLMTTVIDTAVAVEKLQPKAKKPVSKKGKK